MLIDTSEQKEMLLQILNSDFAIPIKYANIAAELQVAVQLAEVPEQPKED